MPPLDGKLTPPGAPAQSPDGQMALFDEVAMPTPKPPRRSLNWLGHCMSAYREHCGTVMVWHGQFARQAKALVDAFGEEEVVAVWRFACRTQGAAGVDTLRYEFVKHYADFREGWGDGGIMNMFGELNAYGRFMLASLR